MRFGRVGEKMIGYDAEGVAGCLGACAEERVGFCSQAGERSFRFGLIGVVDAVENGGG